MEENHIKVARLSLNVLETSRLGWAERRLIHILLHFPQKVETIKQRL